MSVLLNSNARIQFPLFFSTPVMIVSACLFIMGYAMTWAPGVWILVGETFPTRTRAKQGALSTASNWYEVLISFCDVVRLTDQFNRLGYAVGCGIFFSPSSRHSLRQPSNLDMDLFLLVRFFYLFLE